MTAGSGQRLLPLLKESSPLGYVLKTLLGSSVWNSPACRLTWKVTETLSKRQFPVKIIFGPTSPEKLNSSFAILSRQLKNSDTRSSPLLFQLAASERGTGDTESGLWATPRAYSHGTKSNRPGLTSLDIQVRNLYPTPTQHGNYNRRGASRNSGDGAAVVRRLLPTPKTPTGGGQMERTTPGGGIRKLEDAVSQMEGYNTGQLNPMWVEWLMGYPLGWTDLKGSVTPSSPKSPINSSSE